MSIGIGGDIAVASQAAMLALNVRQGDWCYRSDVKKTYRLLGTDPTVLANWSIRGVPSGCQVYTDEATGVTRIDRKEHAGTILMLSNLLNMVYANTWTPTLTNVANLSASAANPFQYMRVNNVVTFSGAISMDPVLAATATSIGISLPVASNFANTYECAGGAFCGAIAGMGAAINADTANKRINLFFVSTDVNNQTWSVWGSYQVI